MKPYCLTIKKTFFFYFGVGVGVCVFCASTPFPPHDMQKKIQEDHLAASCGLC